MAILTLVLYMFSMVLHLENPLGIHAAFAAPLSCVIFPTGEFPEGKMASIERQPVTIHYRRLEDVTGAFGARTVHTALRAALRHEINGEKLGEHWSRRAWTVPPSDEDTYLMNLHHDHRDYFFGDLTHYTKGYHQALLAQASDAPMVQVEQLPPPRGKEYIHSMMYWMAVRNHLFMIQSRSLGSKQLEEYLTWLLKDRAGIISGSGHVILKAKFDADEVGGDLDDIQEIIVGGRAPSATEVADKPQPGAAGFAEGDEYHKLGTRKPLWTRALDVLRAAMSNEADVQEFLRSVPPEAELDVSVHIGYKARTRRPISRAPMQTALRNLPDGEITAKGPGGRMTGNDIRLTYKANVIKNGNLLDIDDAIRALREAHDHLAHNGKIEIES